MRTTLTIDDELLARAKRQALDLGLTVSEVVNRNLRWALAARPEPAPRRPTLTFGDPAVRALAWSDRDRLIEDEDVRGAQGRPRT